MLFANAQMRDILAILVDDFALGIVQAKLAVLDAKLPATAHGLVVVLDTESLAFGDADLGGLAAAGTDGVVDASEADILDRGYPISVGSTSILVRVGTKAGGSGSFDLGNLGGRSSRSNDARCRQHRGQNERESHGWNTVGPNLIDLSKGLVEFDCGMTDPMRLTMNLPWHLSRVDPLKKDILERWTCMQRKPIVLVAPACC